MIYERKDISSSILARPFLIQASKMIKHSSTRVCPGDLPAFGLLFRHLPCLLQVFTQLTTLGQFHDDHLSGVLNVSHRIFFSKYNSLRKAYRTSLYTLAKHVNSYCCQVKYLQPSVDTSYQIIYIYMYTLEYACVCETHAVNNLNVKKTNEIKSKERGPSQYMVPSYPIKLFLVFWLGPTQESQESLSPDFYLCFWFLFRFNSSP